MNRLLSVVVVIASIVLSGAVAAADRQVSLKSDNAYLNTAIDKVNRSGLSRTMDQPICICGGDGKGGWSCTPKNCDSNFDYFGNQNIKKLSLSGPSGLTADTICVCGGDGEGNWTCTPKGCDGTPVGSSAAFQKPSIDRQTLPRTMPDTGRMTRPVDGQR